MICSHKDKFVVKDSFKVMEIQYDSKKNISYLSMVAGWSDLPIKGKDMQRMVILKKKLLKMQSIKRKAESGKNQGQ